MGTPKIGDLYRSKNPPASIPGKRKYWGEITDVVEDGHGGYLVEVDYGVEKGDFRNIFVENYEQTEEKTNDMNTTNTIQFIEFPQNHGSRRKMVPNEGVIYKRTPEKSKNGGAHQIRLPLVCKEAIDAGYDKIKVAVNNLTNEVFLVFDKTDGLHVNQKSGDTEGKNNRIVSRHFIEWLENRFGLPSDGGGVVVFSENLSRNNGYTYKIEPKKD